ncbi:hypothetical protein KC887_06690 [Candidatus Kaiserbacteria bacterium]|nr:hypothetical protein [Candidatus Kaiserbacteria bacterium]
MPINRGGPIGAVSTIGGLFFVGGGGGFSSSGLIAYRFNGSDMYATFPAYSTLGDPDVYRDIRYVTSKRDGYVIDESAEPISEFGRVGSNYHQGTIQYLSITDRSPIQNTSVAMANSAMFATCPVITLAGDYEIQFDLIRKDSSGGANIQHVLAYNGGSFFTLRIYDSDHATLPNALRLVSTSGVISFANALSGVGQGEHVRVKVSRSSATNECFINGSSVGTVALGGTLYIDTFMIHHDRSTAPLVSGSAIQNLKMTAGGSSWHFPMNEGSGTTLYNIDSGTGSAYDATLSEENWVEIPGNSRYYLGNSYSGSTISDVLGSNPATIQNYSRDAWVSTAQDDTLLRDIWQKPEGQPVLLAGTGQSNAGAHNIAANPMATNPRVFDFATDGDAPPQVDTPTWISAYTDVSYQKDDFYPTNVYTGYRANGRAYPLAAIADRIQKITGRDVYIVNVFKGSTAISSWIGTGGVGEVLDTRVQQALETSEMVSAGITAPDAVFWLQGESNSGDAPSDYADDWDAWRDQTEAAWAVAGETPFYVYDFSEEWNWQWTTAYGEPEESNIMRYVADNADGPVTLVPSLGIPAEPGGEIHFTGDGANLYAQQMADYFLFDS